MSIKIQQSDLTTWDGFFNHGENNVSLSLLASTTTLQCTNNRFDGLQFHAAHDISALTQNVPLLRKSVLLPLVPSSAESKRITLRQLLDMVGPVNTSSTTPNLFQKIVSRIPMEEDFIIDKKEVRNAMWLTPGNTMQLDTALSFVPVDISLAMTTQDLTSSLRMTTLPSIPLPVILLQRTTRGIQTMFQASDTAQSVTAWDVSTTYRLTLKMTVAGFIFWVSLEPGGTSVTINTDPKADDDHWVHLNDLGMALNPLASKPVADFLKDVQLAQFTVGVDAQGTFCWKLLVTISLQKETSSDTAVDLYLTYNSLSSTFTGGLITSGFYATSKDKLLIAYEPGTQIDLPVGKSYDRYWNLSQYFSEEHRKAIPKALPMSIQTARVSFASSTTKVVSFSAQVVSTDAATTPATGETSPKALVPTPFVWEELGVDFTLSKSATQTIVTCVLACRFILNPPVGSSLKAADLGISIAYNDGDWTLQGHAGNLSFGLLSSFCEDDSSDALMSMLGKLNIASLDLLLTHDKDGGAASFLFTGIVDFGELQLRLFYQYTSTNAGENQTIRQKLVQQGGAGEGPTLLPSPPAKQGQAQTSWTVECDLGASTGEATIGTLANSILEDSAGDIPAFLANIKIPKADGTNGRAPIYLKAFKTDDNKILFVLRISIGLFTLTLLQITSVKTDPKQTQAPTKRLIRFAVDKIPLIENIPLLASLPQPFDDLEYVWVNKTGGLLKSEVDAFTSAKLLTGKDTLRYKVSGKTDASSKDVPDPPTGSTTSRPAPNNDPVVLTEGHHFIVVHEGQVAVDHVFFASPAPTPTPVQPTVADPQNVQKVIVAPGTDPQQPKPSPPAKGALSFKLGPTSIDAVTLHFKEQAGKQVLTIVMDATFTMGPITFSLLGFGLSIAFDGLTLDKLSHVLDDDFMLVLADGTKIGRISVVLSGLALAFNKPPLLVAGGFEHAVAQVPGGTEDVFMGGIGVSYPPYTFVGLGEYKVVTVNGQTYKSVFLFAKLDGPLVTLELATISGVRLGLGYNSMVRPPSTEEITQFPFIDDGSISGAGNDPMAILKMMTGGSNPWVTSKLNSYWFAAGMSVTAFDILTVTAVAMLAFRETGAIGSIYADAIARMPPNAPKQALIVYAEIGIVAEVNFIDGYFRVDAALAPTSFLLVPESHLYGSFAMVYWFPPSDHTGDWVFSVGGYHRSYIPPPWYPVPQRLGVSFNVGILSITGEAYFAITPKCVMGGAMLHASLAFGPIQAWLDATFDALIQFHPLHYSVDFSVAIGVNFNLDVLFIHIHIGAHVGAQLHIEGPEFGGSAHVDFWLLGFDVDFGASPQQPQPLDLLQFWLMLHKPGPDSSGDATQQHAAPLRSFLTYDFQSQDPDHKTSPQSIPGAAFKYVLEDGNFPMPASPPSSAGGDTTSTGAGSKWYVKGGSFAFRVATDFALSAGAVKMNDEAYTELKAAKKKAGGDPDKVSQFPTADTSKTSIYSKPMHILASKPVDGKPVDGNPVDSKLVDNNIISKLDVVVTSRATGEIIDSFRSITLATKDMPTAIWDPYDPAQDPQKRPDSLLNGDNATVPQCMSLVFAPPLPYLAPPIEFDDLGLFIPKFKATAAAKFAILDFRTTEQKGGIQGDTTHGTDWFVPKSESVQTQYLPMALTADERKMSNKDRWNATRKSWNALASKQDIVADKDDGVLVMFAKTLAWDQKRPQTETAAVTSMAQPVTQGVDVPAVPVSVREPWELAGGLPSKMIANLEAVYLDLPRMAVIAV